MYFINFGNPSSFKAKYSNAMTWSELGVSGWYESKSFIWYLYLVKWKGWMWKFLKEIVIFYSKCPPILPWLEIPSIQWLAVAMVSVITIVTQERESWAPHHTIQVLEWWLCLLWLSDRTRETRDSSAHTLQTWGGPRPGSCCSASGPPSPSVGYTAVSDHWPLWFFNLEINTVIIHKILAPTSVFLLTDSYPLTQNYVFSTLKLGDLV